MLRTELTRLSRASQITLHGGATGDENRHTVAPYFLLVWQMRESGILRQRLQRNYVC
jgi:hypothetical protein